jgi:formamidopyrimidine-DNA glycosylase
LRVLLDDDGRLFSHLGMTGWWVALDVDSPKQPSERARLDVVRSGRASSVRYLDSRRFGRLLVAHDDIPEWSTLGPELLDDDFDETAFAAQLARSRRAIKDVVMDQSIVAGIGNILATEALWHARIDPRSNSDALSRSDVARLTRGLHKAIQRQLTVRLAAEGDDWVDRFSAYGRSGEPCSRCGSPIARIVMTGRTTTFCKVCQIRHKRRRASK